LPPTSSGVILFWDIEQRQLAMNFYSPPLHMTQLTAANLNEAMPAYNDDSVLDQQRRALQAAIHAFDQAPAPSLREVLAAYRLKGDGDREMLLAVLNAKAAEDQVSINPSFYAICIY
jgi:hypothetical protein